MSTPNGGEQELHQLDLNLHPNEASGLLAIKDGPLLEAHDWEYGLWVVMDEAEAEHCGGAIGHKRPGASVPGAGGLRGVCYAEPGGRKLADLVHEGDFTINIEGAASREDGSLLVGLRYPVEVEGRPILVDLVGTERLFEPYGGGQPEVVGFTWAYASGPPGCWVPEQIKR